MPLFAGNPRPLDVVAPKKGKPIQYQNFALCFLVATSFPGGKGQDKALERSLLSLWTSS